MIQSIGYLGPCGTFSHLITMRRYPDDHLVDFFSVSAVFKAVVNSSVNKGIVPIENSSGGMITETVDRLIEFEEEILITEELSMNVKLALIGLENTKLSSIRTLYSHPMPFQYARHWIENNLYNVDLIECSSTAESLIKVQQNTNFNSAALAAPQSAKIYHLSILKFPLDSEILNITNFLSIIKKSDQSIKVCDNNISNISMKTSLIVQISQLPGSLYNFLEPFAKQKINLSRIVSRPILGQPKKYLFYIEVENTCQKSVFQKVIQELYLRSEKISVMGSYLCDDVLQEV